MRRQDTEVCGYEFNLAVQSKKVKIDKQIQIRELQRVTVFIMRNILAAVFHMFILVPQGYHMASFVVSQSYRIRSPLKHEVNRTTVNTIYVFYGKYLLQL